MINVMQLVQHFKVGGLEKMVFELRRKSIHHASTHVVALEDSSQTWPELAALPNLHSLNKQPGIQLLVVSQLVEYIDKNDIRLIHSHHVGPMLYASLAIAKRPHVKHVTTVHDAWYLQQWRMRLITWAICKFTAVNVVADAEAVAQEVSQKIFHQPNEVVINGIDSTYFSPINQKFARYQLSLPQDARLIGCGARVEAGKGHQAMISQLRLLPNDIHLVFAGDGALKTELMALSQTYGVASRVHWLGRISKMQVFYSAIDVFCLFSEREGLPLALLEAMACNRPVVASDVGGVKEVVNPDAGIVLNKDDIGQLAPALLKAFSLKQNNIRDNNLSLVCSSLMAKRYDAIYQTLCV